LFKLDQILRSAGASIVHISGGTVAIRGTTVVLAGISCLTAPQREGVNYILTGAAIEGTLIVTLSLAAGPIGLVAFTAALAVAVVAGALEGLGILTLVGDPPSTPTSPRSVVEPDTGKTIAIYPDDLPPGVSLQEAIQWGVMAIPHSWEDNPSPVPDEVPETGDEGGGGDDDEGGDDE